jgi:diaminopimelate epimerase
MHIRFHKYQGTGNDFILLDNRLGEYNSLEVQAIRSLCDRRFGVGADGLIRINTVQDAAFEVDYYNADGSKSFCGNGARCAVAFAETLGIDVSEVKFDAIDGYHVARKRGGLVALEMLDVTEVKTAGADYVLETGSPHYIVFQTGTKTLDVVAEGRKIRYSDVYRVTGINVNFVEMLASDRIRVLTYERGVEDETLSCGTGVTAAALALAVKNKTYGEQLIHISTKGGELQVRFTRTGENHFEGIELIGPAEFVFKGEADV